MVENSDTIWITDEEKKLVIQLKDKLGDKLPAEVVGGSEEDETAYLLRWLRARNLSVENAENMLLTALEWRQENQVDTALQRTVDPFLAENYKWKVVAEDHGGRPISCCPLEDWDFRKIFAAGKANEFDLFVQNFFESVIGHIKASNEKRPKGLPPVTQFFIILDVGNFPYGQYLSFAAIKKWLQMAGTYEAYYPEVLYKAIWINCPSWFNLFLSLLKRVLVPRTLEKFTCYGTLDEWKNDINKFMDPSRIPEKYGGTSKMDVFTETPQTTELENKKVIIQGEHDTAMAQEVSS